MKTPLSTNGLLPADDFPAKAYEATHRIVAAKVFKHPLFEEYAAAWNAVAYRFHAAVEAGEAFERSLKTDGATPLPAERYKQDKALAHFFGDGHSTLESVFYAAYAIAAFVEPAGFSLATPADQRKVTPAKTATAFAASFPGDPILQAFDALFTDPAYQEWQRIRNVLTHRSAPGRMMYVGIGSDDAPPPPKPTAGKFSKANLFGLEKVRKDLPKYGKDFSFLAQSWGSGSYHLVTQNRQVYPRDF